MSLLVRYTLKSADDHAAQTTAMQSLTTGLAAENIAGLHYSCFSTADPTEFIGVMEFSDEAAFTAFQASTAFAKYRETVGPTFASPPQATRMNAIASTRG